MKSLSSIPFPRVRGIRKRWLLSSISVLVLLLTVLVIAFSLVMKNYYDSSILSDMESKARTAATYFSTYAGNDPDRGDYLSAAQEYVTSFEDGSKIVNELLEKAKAKNVKIHLGCDFACGNKFAEDCDVKVFTVEEGIEDGWMGLDIGPKTIEEFKETILRANSIIWNGPAGVYEWEKFQAGTRGMLDACVEAKNKGALAVIGGGDCGACAGKWGYADKITHVSTGGGASLELLEGNNMPGLMALSDKQ